MSKQMAKRYEAAWNQLFHERSDWVQKQVIKEPHSHYAGELARDAARLAEDMKVEFNTTISGTR
jgi:hypothetical protein